MKILRLQFLNLNSLKGEFELDFTSSPLADAGIFAITGPTGAGKTTILDAIALALYGETPRLKNISMSTNEIMSRHTGECRSEVDFQVDGKSYRARWEQRRARGKAEGKLQSPQMMLVDLNSGEEKIIAEKIKEVKEKVEELTGLDFARFTRSMMLAQGSFAAFLQANDNDRAELLEKMTGTDVYGRISEMVFERAKNENAILEKLSAKLENLQLMDPEELDQLKANLQQLTDNESKLAKSIKVAESEVTSLKKISELKSILSQIDQGVEDLRKEREAAQSDLLLLQKAEKALVLEADYREMDTVRKQLKKLHEDLGTLDKSLPQLRDNSEKALKNMGEADEALKAFKEDYDAALELIKTVRVLDHDIAIQKKQGEEISQKIGVLRLKCAQNNQVRDQLKIELEKVSNDKKSISKYLDDNAVDKTLRDEFSGIKEQLKSLENLRGNIIKKSGELPVINEKMASNKVVTEKIAVSMRESEDRLKQLKSTAESIVTELKREGDGRSLDELEKESLALREKLLAFESLKTLAEQITGFTKNIGEIEQKVLKTSELLESERVALNAAESEKNTLQETVEALKKVCELEKKIASLESYREQLCDGEPCPLCGALEHPYAVGNVPQVSESEEKLRIRVGDLEEKGLKIGTLQKTIAGFEVKVTTDQDVLKRENARLQDLLVKWHERVTALKLNLNPEDDTELEKQLHKTEADLEKSNLKIATLKSLAEKLNVHEKEIAEAEKSVSQLRLEEEKAAGEGRSLMEQLGREKQELEALSGDFEAKKTNVTVLLGKFYVEFNTETDTRNMLDSLQKRVDEFSRQEKLLLVKEEALQKLAADVRVKESEVAEVAQQLAENEKSLAGINEKLGELTQQRHDKFGEKVAEVEEKGLKNKLVDLDQKAAKQREVFQDVQNQLKNSEERLMHLKAENEDKKEEITSLNRKFLTGLEKNGFENEESLLAALLPIERIEELAQMKLALTERETALSTARKTREEELKVEESREKSGREVSELEEELTAKQTTYKEVLHQKGALDEKLKHQDELKKNQASQMEELLKQQQECKRWDMLNDLIGSKDGRKYRRFAQGLTFEVMISLANKQLGRLNDRYVLQREPDEALGLQVIDTFQADTIRSTKNLSGGEQFLISLSLALGLSQLAGHKARIDSLFLDEGFGTLDQETLDVALAALSSLNAAGKTIGVISHVESLKERIPVKIEVVKEGGGVSRLRLEH